MLQAIARPTFPVMTAFRPLPSCTACGPVDTASLSAAARLAPQLRSAQSLAPTAAFMALAASSAGGHSCFASCMECGNHVHYCVKDAGHGPDGSGAQGHRCSAGHTW